MKRRIFRIGDKVRPRTDLRGYGALVGTVEEHFNGGKYGIRWDRKDVNKEIKIWPAIALERISVLQECILIRLV